MIFNTTEINSNFINTADQVLGESYDWRDKLSKGKTISSKMMIDSLKTPLHVQNQDVLVINYAQIELRPKGVIVYYRVGLEKFSWCIPFFRLVIYKSNVLSIHAEGSFVKIVKNLDYQSNIPFIRKIMDDKVKVSGSKYYDY